MAKVLVEASRHPKAARNSRCPRRFKRTRSHHEVAQVPDLEPTAGLRWQSRFTSAMRRGRVLMPVSSRSSGTGLDPDLARSFPLAVLGSHDPHLWRQLGRVPATSKFFHPRPGTEDTRQESRNRELHVEPRPLDHQSRPHDLDLLQVARRSIAQTLQQPPGTTSVQPLFSTIQTCPVSCS